jgi:triphosphatase
MLARGTTITQAQNAIAANCVVHLASNIAPICARRDPEGLHQAHVATRRLRTMVQVFRPAVPAAQSPAISAAQAPATIAAQAPGWARIDATLQQLGRRLGEARDCHLLLAQGDIPARTARHLRAAAAANHKAICATLHDMHFRADMVTLLTTAGLHPATPDLATWAGAVLDRLLRQLRSAGHRLADQPPEQQHRARIRAKRLRYAMEFFASLFDHRRQRRRHHRLLKHLGALQDSLGTLNDLATIARVLGPGHGASAAARDSLAARAQAQLAAVLDDRPFWR